MSRSGRIEISTLIGHRSCRETWRAPRSTTGPACHASSQRERSLLGSSSNKARRPDDGHATGPRRAARRPARRRGFRRRRQPRGRRASAVGIAFELLVQRGEQGAHRRHRRRLAARRSGRPAPATAPAAPSRRREADDGAGAAEAGHRRQQGLCDCVGDGRARAGSRVGDPAAPRQWQQLEREGRRRAAPVVEQSGIDLGPAADDLRLGVRARRRMDRLKTVARLALRVGF